MRWITLPLLGVIALLFGTAAYGESDKSFNVEGIGVTFKYPPDFKLYRKISFQKSAGSQTAARGAVGADKVNLIIVSRYNLRVAITAQNLARVKAEVDSVIGQVANRTVSGRRVQYGGLPGYEYKFSLTSPARGVSRMAVLFDRATEYLINCQSTPAKRTVLDQACSKALATLRRK
jgi:hypothetical protein